MTQPKFKNDIINGLQDANEAPITNMGASWTSRPYSFETLLHLGVHLYWTNIAITGFLYLEYSCDSVRDKSAIDKWDIKNTVELDGTFDSALFLDAHVPISSFRLRFVHSGGAGAVDAKMILKP